MNKGLLYVIGCLVLAAIAWNVYVHLTGFEEAQMRWNNLKVRRQYASAANKVFREKHLQARPGIYSYNVTGVDYTFVVTAFSDNSGSSTLMYAFPVQISGNVNTDDPKTLEQLRSRYPYAKMIWSNKLASWTLLNEAD